MFVTSDISDIVSSPFTAIVYFVTIAIAYVSLQCKRLFRFVSNIF